MKEHPILFSGEMIKAILAGRKFVTRRLSPQWMKVKAGDRLWVRETWAPAVGRLPCHACGITHPATVLDGCPYRCPVLYRAEFSSAGSPSPADVCSDGGGRWRPSIHMPRWASRILLECEEDTRRERLQDITEEDAELEGVEKSRCGQAGYAMEPMYSYRTGFVRVWSELHTKPGEMWFDNPTVYRVGRFHRVEVPRG